MISQFVKNTSHWIEKVTPLALTPESELVRAIKRDHTDLKALLAVLKDTEEPLSNRRTAYRRFRELLQSHSRAEEKAVYGPAQKYQALKIDALEGEVEHEVCDALVARIQKIRQPGRWAAAVQVLAEIVEHHLQEEEEKLLPEIDRAMSLENKLEAEALFLQIRGESPKAGARAGVASETLH